MSGEVFAISDLHLGHRNILKWATTRGGVDSQTHDEWVIEQIKTVVHKKDTLWILGDIAFSRPALEMLASIPGYKKFILGNHDRLQVTEYMRYGRVYPGLVKWHSLWLSHPPIHPDELRGFRNVHGHVHNNPIGDWRYVSVCVEALNGVPVELYSLLPEAERKKHGHGRRNDR